MVPLKGKKILLGITGGIAAYKAAVLLRELQKNGAEVRCIMTPSALRFLGKDTLSALTRQPVPTDVFPDDSDVHDSWVRHIHWAEWADVFLIAPCTANTLAKIVHGFSDNILTAAVLAARCPVLLCPTMDGGMYNAPASVINRQKANEMGFHLLEPEHGYLASGIEDTGRLPEYETILKKIKYLLDPPETFLKGKKVVVTAGPTREYIDAVRFISNPSSGRMGFAMAEAARHAGAEVTLIHGPVSIKAPENIETLPVISAGDMFEAVKKHKDADVIIMSAAVSDFQPAKKAAHKVKKETAELNIALSPTNDILKWLGANRKSNQVLIGFAMETENLIESAEMKRERKNVDWIIANSLNEPGSGFETETNTVHLIGAEQDEIKSFTGQKTEVSFDCLKYIFSQKS